MPDSAEKSQNAHPSQIRPHRLARVCEQRLTRRVSLAVGTNFVGDGADIPRENMRGGLSETPAGRRQRCRVRHRLGRLLVDVTYKSGTK
jgi:hypothetical protein